MTDSQLELRTTLSKSDTEQQKTVGELVSGNADALALLGHLNIDLSVHRRELIKPHLKREYGALCSTRTPITDFVFGDDLQSQLSSITASNKIGQTTIRLLGAILIAIISLLKISLFYGSAKEGRIVHIGYD